MVFIAGPEDFADVTGTLLRSGEYLTTGHSTHGISARWPPTSSCQTVTILKPHEALQLSFSSGKGWMVCLSRFNLVSVARLTCSPVKPAQSMASS